MLGVEQCSKYRVCHGDEPLNHETRIELYDFIKGSYFSSFAIFVLFPKRLDDTWIGKSCCVTQRSAFGNVTKESAHDLTATRLR